MSDELTPAERLARFTLESQRGEHVTGHDALVSLDLVLDEYATDEESDRAQRRLGLPVRREVTGADALAGLALVREERESLDFRERRFIEAYMDRGGTWPAGAEALGYPSGGALRARYRRLGGTRTWSAGRPASTSVLASREQVAQWQAETLERLAAHPVVVVTPEDGAPGYWVLRTPQGEQLGEEMTDVLAELRERGVQLHRPDDSELRAELDWSRERARALR